MKDELKRERKLLRPMWSFEFNGKGVKKINRKICRKRLNNRWKKDLPNIEWSAESKAYREGMNDCYNNVDYRRNYSGSEFAAYEKGWADAFGELCALDKSYGICDRLR